MLNLPKGLCRHHNVFKRGMVGFFWYDTDFIRELDNFRILEYFSKPLYFVIFEDSTVKFEKVGLIPMCAPFFWYGTYFRIPTILFWYNNDKFIGRFLA